MRKKIRIEAEVGGKRRSATIEADTVHLILGRKKRSFGMVWTTVFSEELVAITPHLRGLLEAQILNYLIGSVEWENVVEGLTQKEMATRLRATERGVRKALERLQELELVRVVRNGRSNVYLLNPYLAWKGNEREWREERKSWRRPSAIARARAIARALEKA